MLTRQPEDGEGRQCNRGLTQSTARKCDGASCQNTSGSVTAKSEPSAGRNAILNEMLVDSVISVDRLMLLEDFIATAGTARAQDLDQHESARPDPHAATLREA